MAVRLKTDASSRGPVHTGAVIMKHTQLAAGREAGDAMRTLRLSRSERVQPSGLGALQHTAARGPRGRPLAHEEPRLLLVEASHVCSGHFFVRLMHMQGWQSDDR
jgi:hypothetical protein